MKVIVFLGEESLLEKFNLNKISLFVKTKQCSFPGMFFHLFTLLLGVGVWK